jgi:hypothetical protein
VRGKLQPVALLSALGQHPGVARCFWRTVGLVALCGCDATVTSVGSLEPPLMEQPAGAGGSGATGAAAGRGGLSGSAGGGSGGEALPEASNTIFLEAESGLLSVAADGADPPPSGFSIVDDVSASNGQYLEPPLGSSDQMPGPARALYRFETAADGDFVIWGRIYSPSATQNRFWFQVDGGTWYRWRISTGEIWYWDDFHDNLNYYSELVFPLSAGVHELQIASCVSGAKLDRLYITSEDDEPPGNDTECNPPHSIEVGGECLPSCGSLAPPGMSTTCMNCDGRPMLPSPDDPSQPKPYDCTVCCIAP